MSSGRHVTLAYRKLDQLDILSDEPYRGQDKYTRWGTRHSRFVLPWAEKNQAYTKKSYEKKEDRKFRSDRVDGTWGAEEAFITGLRVLEESATVTVVDSI